MMFRYVLRRVAVGFFLLWIISLLTFVLFYLLPSVDPAVLRAGHSASPQLIASIRKSLGLNEPLMTQYLYFMRDAFLHFNLGYSYANDESVSALLLSRLPATISLTVGALIIWLTVGISVGILSAVKRGSWIDRITMSGTLLAIAAPAFWLGLVSLFLFSKDVGRFPLFDGASTYVPLTQDPAQWFGSLVLPWCVLAASFAAIYARFMRSGMLEVLDEDYVRTARAKGATERRVVLVHAARAAVTPIVTLVGLDLGILLGGAIFVESVFNIPGIGRLAINAVQNGDIPVIQGTVLLSAAFIIFLNIVVDVLYTWLDPRVSYV
jgi:peptide/nickel transport system permease protein